MGAQSKICSRFPSNPLIIRVPFCYYSDLIRRPQTKKEKRVLLGYLVKEHLLSCLLGVGSMRGTNTASPVFADPMLVLSPVSEIVV